MTTKPKTIVKRITVVLKFPSKITAIILLAKTIYKAMSGNTNFPNSSTKLTTLNNDIAALDAAQTACTTTPPSGSTDARNVALEAVKNDLRALRNDVQTAADAAPTKAEAIITSASMEAKKATTHQKQQNTVKDGSVEGTVLLIGEGSGPHEWRMSTDDSTWIQLPASRTSKTSVADLTPGTLYYFQNRRMLANDVKTEWSQSVKIRVR